MLMRLASWNKFLRYDTKLIYEATGNGRNYGRDYEKGKSGVTVGITKSERGVGQKNDEATVTNDSSSSRWDQQGLNDA
jgi:hypothetical protein